MSSRPSATVAALAIPLAGGSVRCVACAHRCLIRPDRAGICRVRENRDGVLVSLVYGQAVAANSDPIEKKPLFHAYPGSVAFSIATRGCNFHCAEEDRQRDNDSGVGHPVLLQQHVWVTAQPTPL